MMYMLCLVVNKKNCSSFKLVMFKGIFFIGVSVSCFSFWSQKELHDEIADFLFNPFTQTTRVKPYKSI